MIISSVACWLIVQGLAFATVCVNKAQYPITPFYLSAQTAFICGLILGPIILAIGGLQALLVIGIVATGAHTPYSAQAVVMAYIGEMIAMLAGASCTWGIPIWMSIFSKASKIISNTSASQKGGNLKTFTNFLVVSIGILLCLSYGLNYFDPLDIKYYLKSLPVDQILYGLATILVVTVLYPYVSYYQKTNFIRQKEKTGGLIKGD